MFLPPVQSPAIVAKIHTNRTFERYRVMSPAFNKATPFCLFVEYVFQGIAGFEIKMVDSEQTRVIRKVNFKRMSTKMSSKMYIRPQKLSMVSRFDKYKKFIFLELLNFTILSFFQIKIVQAKQSFRTNDKACFS